MVGLLVVAVVVAVVETDFLAVIKSLLKVELAVVGLEMDQFNLEIQTQGMIALHLAL
jgi:hypothetical protein